MLNVSPRTATKNRLYGEFADAVLSGKFSLAQRTRANLSNGILSKFGKGMFHAVKGHMQSVLYGVSDILSPSDVFQIAQIVVRGVTIFVVDFFPFRAWPDKGQTDEPVNILVSVPSVSAKQVDHEPVATSGHGAKYFASLGAVTIFETFNLACIRNGKILRAKRDWFPQFSKHDGIIPCQQLH